MIVNLQNAYRNLLTTFRLLVKHRVGLIGLVIVLVFTFTSLLADLLPLSNPLIGDLSKALRPPEPNHPLGTDELGRDLLSRVVYGTRVSLVIAFVGTTLGCVIGVVLGLISGYFSGLTDFIIMRAVDALLSIPSILIAVALVALAGPGIANIVIALAIGLTPTYVRLARSTVMQVRDLEFVTAAKLLGLSNFRILTKHILPNISYVIIAQYTLDLGTSILFAAGLGFLGLGVQPPTPELGSIIGSGKAYMSIAPHVIIYPGVILVVLVLGFNFLGNALRDVLDPASRVKYA